MKDLLVISKIGIKYSLNAKTMRDRSCTNGESQKYVIKVLAQKSCHRAGTEFSAEVVVEESIEMKATSVYSAIKDIIRKLTIIIWMF